MFIAMGTMLLIITVRNLELLNLTAWASVAGRFCVCGAGKAHTLQDLRDGSSTSAMMTIDVFSHC